MPKYLENAHKNKIKRSRSQEKRIAREYRGRVVAGSGSGREKGDVNTRTYKIEAKRTDTERISIRREWLTKITNQAISVGRLPLLEIEFEGGATAPNLQWVMLEKSEFLRLLSIYERTDPFST